MQLGDFNDGGSQDEPETGVITFFKNGIHVASYAFEENSDGVFHFNVPAGFDEFHLTPTEVCDDDSDFTLVGIAVGGGALDGLANASGKIDISYGADGKGTSPEIDSIEPNPNYVFIENTDGSWTIAPKGSDASSPLELGSLTLNEDGSWQFVQYGPMKHDFVFNVKASDGDGDESTISIAVTPAQIIGTILFEGSGGVNSVYMPQGSTSSNYGSTTPVGEKPTVVVNGKEYEAHKVGQIVDGNDFIATGGDNDHVEGGAGNDTIYLGSGSLNENDNTPTPDASQFVTISEAELFQGGNESNTLSKFQSPAWADAAHGGDGNDRIFGQEHTDLLSGGMGNDQLFGGSEEDFLRGGSGSDILDGGTENDWLRGEEGNDTLTGGTGADTFVWGSGDSALDEAWVDTITDFNISEGDTLSLGDLLQADSIVTATDHNGSMIISIDIDGNGDVEQHIVLDGVTVDNGSIVVNTNHGNLTITDSNDAGNSTSYTVDMPTIPESD